MPKIAVLTDTDSSLPLDIAEKNQITLVPITIQFGEESFKDVFDIDNAEVFARIDRQGKLPSTAAPSPGQFSEAFENAFKAGAEEIICLNISSEMSATYASARQAAELFPGKTIEVLDTRSLAMAQGFMVLAAARAAAQGATMQAVTQAALDVRERTGLYGSLATLKYIAMSGRVSQIAAGLAGMLDIKPVLSLQNGKLELLEKIRTQSKSWNRVVELCKEKAAGREIESMAIHHVKAPDAARQFEELLRAALPCPKDIVYSELAPGLSIHTGAGMVAAIFVTK